MTAPIRREVIVNATPERAFTLFTDEIGEWWPVQSHSVWEGSVAFEGATLVERTADAETVWAEVLEWNPPLAFTMSWHPGTDPATATQVRVEFTAHDDGTLVTLTHSGWERRADADAASREYGEGWIIVLGRFAAAAEPADDVDDRWFVLEHRPGPSLPAGASIFATEQFREHLAFLSRLDDAGILVAAGPLADEDGAGMTIVRIRSSDDPVDIHALATIDDRCVATGYLTVRVRPWKVMVGEG
ncbi:MAG: SRPBCC domain-containing protein [Actinomycetota bacterium]